MIYFKEREKQKHGYIGTHRERETDRERER